MQSRSDNRLVYDHKPTLTSILSIVSLIFFNSSLIWQSLFLMCSLMWCLFLYLTYFFLIINCNSSIIFMTGCVNSIAQGNIHRGSLHFLKHFHLHSCQQVSSIGFSLFHCVHADTLWWSKPREKYTEKSTLVTNYETVTCIHTIPKTWRAFACFGQKYEKILPLKPQTF